MATVVASDVGGGSRSWGGEQRSEGEGGPEGEVEVRGGSGRCVASPGRRGGARQAGREEVEASGALASTRLCLLAEVEEDQGAPGGLG